jgi:hypothetical protein
MNYYFQNKMNFSSLKTNEFLRKYVFEDKTLMKIFPET